MQMTAAQALYDNFRMFIEKHDAPSDDPPLHEYVLEWLERGDAVIESGGDFGTYMQGVVYIIAKWHEDPSILNYKGATRHTPKKRRAHSVVDFSLGALAFDRDYFQAILFRQLLGREY